MMKEPMRTVAFRVPKVTWAALEAKAKEIGISPGAYARMLVTEALNGQSFMMEELREMEERQLRLDRNLKTATVAILVDAGKASVEEAETFVRESMS